MIWTDEEFASEAMIFFNEEAKYLSFEHSFDIETDALSYVRKSSKFKYKDHVEAGVLVNCLVKFGYIEFDKKVGDVRYHRLTEKGIEYIKNQKNKN
ncbi:hypothetical protein [Flavobacterium mekongense]|uniref:hypothetical protein n=1 Tax=Flavobacterium mekongense TaxID=3379707 RepID=UPI00399B05F7